MGFSHQNDLLAAFTRNIFQELPRWVAQDISFVLKDPQESR